MLEPVKLNQLPSKDEALEVVESLRRDVESGKIVAFHAVGIAADDMLYRYQGMSRPVTYLRIVGALEFAKAGLWWMTINSELDISQAYKTSRTENYT
jgi:hypothetical protein